MWTRCPRSPTTGPRSTQEEILRAGPVPYSIVRATQFFEFVEQILSWTTDGGTVRLPTTRLQPVAADDALIAPTHHRDWLTR